MYTGVVDTGAGDDIINVDGSIRVNGTIYAGEGNDEVNIGGDVIGKSIHKKVMIQLRSPEMSRAKYLQILAKIKFSSMVMLMVDLLIQGHKMTIFKLKEK
ncbi:hypothetical protein [Psychrobacter phenylpyruvicus]|uniref:Uncharacterized protein n=1 Tax=Psychrobacter phenylpyruvicus TaxID=29432 RepID=A0A379LR59_9GAMM|nr:hypothetical protein [Psychrobacter phenylpyruvicus]SUD98869.1 Uncharacterised protein [Psychrobacter phenylpyruvicus]